MDCSRFVNANLTQICELVKKHIIPLNLTDDKDIHANGLCKNRIKEKSKFS